MSREKELLIHRRKKANTPHDEFSNTYGEPLEKLADRVIAQQGRKDLPSQNTEHNVTVNGVKSYLAGLGHFNISEQSIAQEILRAEEEKEQQLAWEEQLSEVQKTTERNERYATVQETIKKEVHYRKSTFGWHGTLPLHDFLQKSHQVLDMVQEATGTLDAIVYEVDIPTKYESYTDMVFKKFLGLAEVTQYLREQRITSCRDYNVRILFGNSRVEGELSSEVKRRNKDDIMFTGIMSFAIPFLLETVTLVNMNDTPIVKEHQGVAILAWFGSSLSMGIYNGMRMAHNNRLAYGMNLAIKPAKVEYSPEEVQIITGMMEELKRYKV